MPGTPTYRKPASVLAVLAAGYPLAASARPRSIASVIRLRFKVLSRERASLSQTQCFPQPVDLRLGLLVHNNFIRPRTSKTLALPFPRRIDTHLRSKVLQACGMVQRVDRPE